MMNSNSIFDDDSHAEQSFLWVWSGHRSGSPCGSFAESLVYAFVRADGENFRRLASVYPAYAKAYKKIQEQG